MDVNSIASAIGSLGFPIVACIIMFYTNYKQQELHKEEMAKLNESLVNNTLAITKLSDKLDGVIKK